MLIARGARTMTIVSAIIALAVPRLLADPPQPFFDDTDRSAFRAWFTFFADAQFERPTDDVTDCASLVRHAYREPLRPHSPAWYRQSRLPQLVAFADVRHTPPVQDGAWLLFRIAPASAQASAWPRQSAPRAAGRDPDRFAEFADAATLVRFNTRLVGREATFAQPGDLLYFRQEGARSPDHLMIVVGESRFDPSRRDWIVYHTGPQDDARGEVRKVSLADLERHPAPRWRPLAANPAFVGVFRLAILDRER